MKGAVTTTMKRGEVEAPSRGWRTPRGCRPPLLQKGHHAPPLYRQLEDLSFPSLFLHQFGECLAKR
jgi:hypothetical protein